MKKILIIDDEKDICLQIKGLLEDEGFAATTAYKDTQALDEIDKKKFDLILLDIWLQGSDRDGLCLLKDMPHHHTPVIMMSGHGTLETAISAIQKGAYDFLEKPFKIDKLLLVIKQAMSFYDLKNENTRLKKQDSRDTWVTPCPSITAIMEKSSQHKGHWLITGMPGSGKHFLAHQIHTHLYAHLPFITHTFTNDTPLPAQDQPSYVHLMLNHTLTPDEWANIANYPQPLVITTNHTQNIPENQNPPLKTVHLKSLNKRPDDLMFFIKHHFRNQAICEAAYNTLTTQKCSLHIGDILMIFALLNTRLAKNPDHRLVGPFLSNIIQGLEAAGSIDLQLVDNHEVTEDFSQGLDTLYHPDDTLKNARDKFERLYLTQQLRRFDGNVSKTAQHVGMDRSAFHRKLKALNI
jgi:two-component system nitrogen regulation response regulator NtrX